jgi:endoglucanase
MLLATAADDRASFDTIWTWTRENLAIRKDHLIAWKWDPEQRRVTDMNNATDADLLSTWALLRAASQWSDPEYERQARTRLLDIREHLVRDSQYGPILVPGADGFVHANGVTVNLSYWVFPALTYFQKAEPDGPWRDVIETGLRLLDRASLGEHGLPPDWLALGDPPSPSDLYEPRFGYEALRIPLYACWDGIRTEPALRNIEKFWDEAAGAPAWVNVVSGEVADYALQSGGQAIHKLLSNCMSGTDFEPSGFDADASYYDNTLILLARVASNEQAG